MGRNQRSADIEDVFSAGIWLASAPLHEAGKTTKSGNTLKTGIGRGQLSFASDNPSSNPNACPLISIFSKPHSEVASPPPYPRPPRKHPRSYRRFSDVFRLPSPHKSRFTSVSQTPAAADHFFYYNSCTRSQASSSDPVLSGKP